MMQEDKILAKYSLLKINAKIDYLLAEWVLTQAQRTKLSALKAKVEIAISTQETDITAAAKLITEFNTLIPAKSKNTQDSSREFEQAFYDYSVKENSYTQDINERFKLTKDTLQEKLDTDIPTLCGKLLTLDKNTDDFTRAQEAIKKLKTVVNASHEKNLSLEQLLLLQQQRQQIATTYNLDANNEGKIIYQNFITQIETLSIKTEKMLRQLPVNSQEHQLFKEHTQELYKISRELDEQTITHSGTEIEKFLNEVQAALNNTLLQQKLRLRTVIAFYQNSTKALPDDPIVKKLLLNATATEKINSLTKNTALTEITPQQQASAQQDAQSLIRATSILLSKPFYATPAHFGEDITDAETTHPIHHQVIANFMKNPNVASNDYLVSMRKTITDDQNKIPSQQDYANFVSSHVEGTDARKKHLAHCIVDTLYNNLSQKYVAVSLDIAVWKAILEYENTRFTQRLSWFWQGKSWNITPYLKTEILPGMTHLKNVLCCKDLPAAEKLTLLEAHIEKIQREYPHHPFTKKLVACTQIAERKFLSHLEKKAWEKSPNLILKDIIKTMRSIFRLKDNISALDITHLLAKIAAWVEAIGKHAPSVKEDQIATTATEFIKEIQNLFTIDDISLVVTFSELAQEKLTGYSNHQAQLLSMLHTTIRSLFPAEPHELTGEPTIKPML